MTSGQQGGPGAAGMIGAAAADIIKDTTTANFARDVIEASKSALVLVDFWAPWCGPCKQLTPLIEKVVRSYNGAVKLVKMNTDEHPSIAGQLRVQSLPTVYAFRDGKPLDGFMGAQPESAIRQFIDRLVGEDKAADLGEALKAATEVLLAGDLQQAAEIYASILQEDPQNAEALAGLAQCYIKSDDFARAEQTIGLVPPDKRKLASVMSVHAAIELAKQGAEAGDTAVHEAAIAADPKNHQARIDLSIALAARGKKLEAVDQLIEAIRLDRKWSDEAARKQLVKFFEAWGFKDEAAVDGRRKLSSVLFS
ncbi:MAG: thioredoxin [Hyphomicrobiaceae bacterium]|nr:thioredoxin [Hyphomicrobiaceae bacterium]